MKTPKKGSPRSSNIWAARSKKSSCFPSAADAWQWHQTIMGAEMAHNLEREWDKRPRRSYPNNCARRSSAAATCARWITNARSRQIAPMHDSFVELFEQRYDAILTPAAPSAAPKGLTSTGDPSFCTLWTLCGMPCDHACRYCRAPTACPSACNWSGRAAVMRGFCARRGGWRRRSRVILANARNFTCQISHLRIRPNSQQSWLPVYQIDQCQADPRDIGHEQSDKSEHDA